MISGRQFALIVFFMVAGVTAVLMSVGGFINIITMEAIMAFF